MVSNNEESEGCSDLVRVVPSIFGGAGAFFVKKFIVSDATSLLNFIGLGAAGATFLCQIFASPIVATINSRWIEGPYMISGKRAQSGLIPERLNPAEPQDESQNLMDLERFKIWCEDYIPKLMKE